MNSKIIRILRLLLAAILIVFGVNKFFDFLPGSEEGLSQEAADFMTTLMETGYSFKFIGVIEIFSGVLFLFNKWIPFALLVIAPISINIILYHLALDIKGILPGAIMFVIIIILFYYNWERFKSLFEK